VETKVAPRRIGIFGGTFDPVHIGHLVIVAELKHALAIDHVLVIPAGDPPHKPDQPLTAALHRVRMLQLALENRTGYAIDRIDLERAGPSYTADTLTELNARYPVSQLVFLMGEDSLRDFHSWRDPERILELAEIGVGCRPGVAVDLAAVYERLPSAQGRVSLVDVPQIDVASSDLRRRVASGEPIAFQVLPAVESYIYEYGLYGKSPG
jgi:nicotinate-nucleotide adenylyltransferase